MRRADPDAKALRQIIAQTRVSVISGVEASQVKPSEADEVAVEDLLDPAKSPVEESLQVKQMIASELEKLELGDEPITGLSAPKEPAEFSEHVIDYDEFSDDFARMTLYLHGVDQKMALPSYAEVTLDSDLFDMSNC
eukprot:m.147468 g.147468  ORF g.147468 m.147468 type:complete len:137 (+) comp14164_c0_seq15:494-904(+)